MMGSFLKVHRQAVNKKTEIQRETIYVTKLDRIDISTSEADVEILIHDDARIDIDLETYEGGPRLTTHSSSGRVEISAKGPNKRILLIGGALQCRLKITVPKDIADSWSITTGSGDLSITKLVTNSLYSRSSSGNLNAADIKVRETHLKTSSGEINARDCNVNKLHMETSSGDLELTRIYGDIMVSTSSGEVNVMDLKGGEVEIKSSSGEINLKNITVMKAIFRTSSGDIKANYLKAEKVLVNTSSGDMEFNVFAGNMKGYTSSGDTILRLINDCTLDIGTSSGDLTVVFEEKNLNTTVEIGAGSGEVISNLLMNVDKQSKNMLKGTTGEGGNPIRLKTGSGDVHIS